MVNGSKKLNRGKVTVSWFPGKGIAAASIFRVERFRYLVSICLDESWHRQCGWQNLTFKVDGVASLTINTYLDRRFKEVLCVKVMRYERISSFPHNCSVTRLRMSEFVMCVVANDVNSAAAVAQMALQQLHRTQMSASIVQQHMHNQHHGGIPSSYQYDPSSGYYYDPHSQLYYDPNTQVRVPGTHECPSHLSVARFTTAFVSSISGIHKLNSS